MMAYYFLGIIGKVITFICLSVLTSVCLIAPGLFLWSRFRLRNQWPISFCLVIVPCVVGLSGYLLFFVYLGSPLVGTVMSLVFIVGSLLLAPQLKTRDFPLDQIKLPFILALLTLFFYNGLTLKNDPRDGGARAAQRVGQGKLTDDNLLPFFLAEGFAKGGDPRDMGATWHSSDRPPLQAGVYLIVRPIFSSMGLNANGYQIVGVFLQSFWVIALFFLSASLKLNLKQIFIAFLFLLFSGFVFINSVFVWPKLVAAAYCILAFSILFYWSEVNFASHFAALAAALGMLSHGGSAFALLAFVPFCFLSRPHHWLKRALIMANTFLLLLLPWSLYKTFYDPPGNRLEKMHLAGVEAIDGRSLSQSLWDAYSHLSLKQFLQIRQSNVERLWNGATLNDWLQLNWENIRVGQFFSLFHAMGILNLGLVLLLVGAGGAQLRRLFYVSWLSIFIWIVIMFAPGSTALVLGSYAPPLLLLFSSAVCLEQVFKKWIWVLLGIHASIFALVWASLLPPDWFPAGIPWAFTSLVAILGMVRVYERSFIGIGHNLTL